MTILTILTILAILTILTRLTILTILTILMDKLLSSTVVNTQCYSWRLNDLNVSPG